MDEYFERIAEQAEAVLGRSRRPFTLSIYLTCRVDGQSARLNPAGDGDSSLVDELSNRLDQLPRLDVRDDLIFVMQLSIEP